MTNEQIAQLFHEQYELLAPSFGYSTREESRKPWADVPPENRALMVAVCGKVREELMRSTIAAPAQQSDDATIDAAEALASLYDGDDRQDIKTDVMNAFYAGVKFACAAPAQELTTPNTLGGFRGGFIGTHGHAPSEQEIWNAAVRSGMNRAAPTSTAAPVAPEGFVLVPIEPTPEMMLRESGCQHHASDDMECSARNNRRNVWKAMLAAAPKHDA